MKKNNWTRIIHRDLGFFYLGLILSFSISGIALNHRDKFNTHEYVVETKEIQLDTTNQLLLQDDEFFRSIANDICKNQFRGIRRHDANIHLYYKDAFAKIDLHSGKGEIEILATVPILGQMAFLHQSMNKWWIVFSDVFAISLIIIAITGILLSKGKHSFKRRGWLKVGLGLIFPFIILLIFM